MAEAPWGSDEPDHIRKKTEAYLKQLGFPYQRVDGEGIEWALQIQVGRWTMGVMLPSAQRIVRFETGVRVTGPHAATVAALPRDVLEQMLVRLKILLLNSNVDYQLKRSDGSPLEEVGIARHVTADGYDAQSLFASLLRLKDCNFKVIVAIEAAALSVKTETAGPRKISLPREDSQASDISLASTPLLDQAVDPDTWDQLYAARDGDETVQDVILRLLAHWSDCRGKDE